MSNKLKNQLFFLGRFTNEQVGADNHSLFVTTAKDMLEPWFLEQSNWFKTSRCIYEGVMIIIGTYFRCIVYKHWFKKYQRKEIGHIDTLLFVLVSTQHLNMLMYFFSTALKISTEVSDIEALGYVAGTCFCNTHMFLQKFDALYKYVGGLGIALYRILLIAHPDLVEFKIGKNRLYQLVLCGGLIITIFSTIPLYLDDYNKLFMEKCIHAPRRILLQSLDEYEQSLGNESIYFFYASVRMYLSMLDIFCAICTMMIYIIFFRILYKHDNDENLKRLLEPEVIRRRNQRNAITFFGQFCSFVLQMIVVALFITQVLIKTSENQLFDIFLMLRTTLFTGMATIEVLTSKNLRSQLLGKENI